MQSSFIFWHARYLFRRKGYQRTVASVNGGLGGTGVRLRVVGSWMLRRSHNAVLLSMMKDSPLLLVRYEIFASLLPILSWLVSTSDKLGLGRGRRSVSAAKYWMDAAENMVVKSLSEKLLSLENVVVGKCRAGGCVTIRTGSLRTQYVLSRSVVGWCEVHTKGLVLGWNFDVLEARQN